jgi:hypothetical protein
MPKLTILTRPVPLTGIQALYEYGYRSGRWVKQKLTNPYYPLPAKYGGHAAVTRSVVEGLTKIGADFNYNPWKVNDLAEIVHVVGGVRPLLQMVPLKQQGRIKRLFAGPNIVEFSTDAESIIASPEIDGLVTHSDSARQILSSDHPELFDKFFFWPAGVDVNFWKPSVDQKPGKTILIYDKRDSPETDPFRIKPYVDYLANQGYVVNLLTKTTTTGQFSTETYLDLLQRSDLMIGFTRDSGEQQGITWSEAWSVNVPTLILQVEETEYRGRRFRTHAAPYLSDATGAFFTSFEEFRLKFQAWERGQLVFNPRDWVLQYLSDEASARLLYHYVTGEEI